MIEADQALRQNIRLLGDLLGSVLEAQLGAEGLAQIEQVRQAAKQIKQERGEGLAALEQHIHSLSDEQLAKIAHAFSLFLNGVNLSEQHHRVRRMRWHERETHRPQRGSLEAFFTEYMQKAGSKERLQVLIQRLEIDLVLTAHPTEVMRRTLMKKYDHLVTILEGLDNPLLTQKQRKGYQVDLFRELTAIWHTPEVRDHKPSPLDEAQWGFFLVESSLWEALPCYMREFSELSERHLGYPLPLDASPVRFSSWMGGDRDGNPLVTAEVTAKTCLMARWVAADLYLNDLQRLRAELSMDHCSAPIRVQVGPAEAPYRAFLKPLKTRLQETKLWIEGQLTECSGGSLPVPASVLSDQAQLLEPLLACYRSLQEIGAGCVAEGHLLDMIRRVHCFGLTLFKLDIRQEASVHALYWDQLTQGWGLGSYLQWSEAQRWTFLHGFCQENRREVYPPPEWGAHPGMDVFPLMATFLGEGLGAYVISMANRPSDVLAVVALQALAGIKKPLRVVPLFETQAALGGAPQMMQFLWSDPWYRRYTARRQEVMIGYSDSAKEMGILAAAWAQYQTQEALLSLAKEQDFELTLFHGRGGTVGRGGGPAHGAVLSQPPGSVAGRLRVTQQGEVIRNRFGLVSLARRTLALYTTATLKATLEPPVEPKPAWRRCLDQMAQRSEDAYRNLLENQDFMTWFARVTPLKELAQMTIGSRPARRPAESEAVPSLKSLRAIPWTFAWTQNRWILPAWFGVGQALQEVITQGSLGILQEMNKDWPFFSSFISLLEMSLAKVDKEVALHYAQRLEGEGACFSRQIVEAFSQTLEAMKECLGSTHLLSDQPLLQRAIQLRNPYILPLHVLQMELLSRLRRNPEQRTLQEAFFITVVGISAGMRNTG